MINFKLLPQYYSSYSFRDLFYSLRNIKKENDHSHISKFLNNSEIYFTNYARTSLRLALSSLNLKKGAKVGVQAFTCHTVFEAIVKADMEPVFIDIDKTFTLDFKDLKKKVSLGNIKIAFELDLKPIRVFNFIKNFDNSFGVNYDLGNSAFYGYYFNNEKIYFSRVINIHLKDRNQLGYSVPFGKGKAEFDNLFKYIKKIKYKNLFILQSYIPKKIGSKTHTLKNLEFIKQFYDKKK